MTNKKPMPPAIFTENTITIVLNGKTETIHKDNVNFNEVKKAFKAGDYDAILTLVNPVLAVKNFVKGRLEYKDGVFTYQGFPLNSVLTGKMLNMMKQGFPIDPMVNFINNLMENPSKRAVEELYSFLEKNNLPLTEDGHFLAYKKIRGDYLDIHSGTMDNSVGKVLEMPRNMVDEDKNRTCSAGLHFCSISYLPHFGGSSGTRVVILKINPKDVVAIPADYNDSKGRTCRYEVIGEIDHNGNPVKDFTKKAVYKGKRVPLRDSNGKFVKKASKGQ